MHGMDWFRTGNMWNLGEEKKTIKSESEFMVLKPKFRHTVISLRVKFDRWSRFQDPT